MKYFILKFSIFSLILLVISLGFDVFVSSRIKKSPSLAKGEYSVWNDIYEGKINSDLVIYGSSRAWVHFNPELLTNTFKIPTYNLGIDGQNFLLQYFRHKELLRFNKRPKIILHSLDIFTFSKKTKLYNFEQFFPYMLYNINIQRATSQYEGFAIFEYLVPGLRYFGKKKIIDKAFNFNEIEMLSYDARVKGFNGRNMIWNDDLLNAKKKLLNMKY
jgi:hypothetical protein